MLGTIVRVRKTQKGSRYEQRRHQMAIILGQLFRQNFAVLDSPIVRLSLQFHHGKEFDR